MSELEPLRSKLRTDVDAPTTGRVWRGVIDLRAARQRAKHRFLLFGAFAFGVVVAVLSLTTVGRFRIEPRVAAHDESTGPLKLRDGEPWGEIEAPRDADRTIDLDDGSHIALHPGGRLATRENTGRSVVVDLAAGRAVFDVQPGGPRHWFIEAGLATVEVVGTLFIVDRTESKVVVDVERGTVLVRGEGVPDHVRVLEAGQRLQIQGPLPPEPVTSAAQPPPFSARPQRIPVARDDSSWLDLAAQGEYAAAYRSLGAEGIIARTKTADLDQLLALADVARFSGHAADAVEPLRRAVTEHPHDPGAAIAAFTLGRVHLDALGDPVSAAHDFRDALSRGVPLALAEDAYLRLMEAQAKGGDRSGAHQTWEEYVEKFPQTPRRALADRWGREP